MCFQLLIAFHKEFSKLDPVPCWKSDALRTPLQIQVPSTIRKVAQWKDTIDAFTNHPHVELIPIQSLRSPLRSSKK